MKLTRPVKCARNRRVREEGTFPVRLRILRAVNRRIQTYSLNLRGNKRQGVRKSTASYTVLMTLKVFRNCHLATQQVKPL